MGRRQIGHDLAFRPSRNIRAWQRAGAEKKSMGLYLHGPVHGSHFKLQQTRPYNRFALLFAQAFYQPGADHVAPTETGKKFMVSC